MVLNTSNVFSRRTSLNCSRREPKEFLLEDSSQSYVPRCSSFHLLLVEGTFLYKPSIVNKSLLSIRLGLQSQGCLHALSTGCLPSICAIRTSSYNTFLLTSCADTAPSSLPLDLSSAQLLHSNSGPDMSFDTLASPEYMSGLTRATLEKVVSHVAPLVVSEETIPHHVPTV
ncbi:hypothetical protein Tco_0290319 [Tanacetum coccineum]